MKSGIIDSDQKFKKNGHNLKSNLESIQQLSSRFALVLTGSSDADGHDRRQLLASGAHPRARANALRKVADLWDRRWHREKSIMDGFEDVSCHPAKLWYRFTQPRKYAIDSSYLRQYSMHSRYNILSVNKKLLCFWGAESNVHNSAVFSGVDVLTGSHGGALLLETSGSGEVKKHILHVHVNKSTQRSIIIGMLVA
jgi:hypothetical protein